MAQGQPPAPAAAAGEAAEWRLGGADGAPEPPEEGGNEAKGARRKVSNEAATVWRFWIAVCENGAASEVVVNLWLPWLLCDWRDGAMRAPSDFTVNTVVLWLNLASAWMEGFFKSTRLLTQSTYRNNREHERLFILSHGFSLGFLNVSSSFPDIGGGASDFAVAAGSVWPGVLYVMANLLGSLWLYQLGRVAGVHVAERRWESMLAFCRLWPSLVRLSVLVSFIFVVALGHFVPLDLGYPDMPGIGSEPFSGWMARWRTQCLGLAFGIFMSVTGCIAAALSTEFWERESHRCLARLGANLASTVVVMAVQQVAAPGFMLMKFSSSFCGAFSAFSSTIGDVFDDTFGAPEEEPLFRKPRPEKKASRDRTDAVLTGPQNMAFHTLMTVSIMAFGVAGHGPVTPILLTSRPCSRLPGAFTDRGWQAAILRGPRRHSFQASAARPFPEIEEH